MVLKLGRFSSRGILFAFILASAAPPLASASSTPLESPTHRTVSTADTSAPKPGPFHCVIPGLRGQRSRDVLITNLGKVTVAKATKVHVNVNRQDVDVPLAADLPPGGKMTLKNALPGSEPFGWMCACQVAPGEDASEPDHQVAREAGRM